MQIEEKISNTYIRKAMNYFKNFTVYFVIMESILCFIPLLMIVIFSLMSIFKYTNIS